MSDDTGDTPPAAAATVRAPIVPRMGGALGRYELGEVLGQGAMATVFRARDTRLHRQVAVKVMNLAMAARSESAERFRREAQAVAAVKHPGIVEIFDFVAAVPPEPAYIVSELIEGPTLRALLDERRGRVLPEAAALLALPVAEALAVAHARGIIHRDVKPENVMIDRGGNIASGGGGLRPPEPIAGGAGPSQGPALGPTRVVLADFGVAHVTGLETMTATGALVGSPAYMSPEQARGHDVGPGSDLWALGVMLYQMATGTFPFNGRDPLMVVAAITRGVFRRPSHVSPFVSPAFDEICAKCLQLDLRGRYTGAEALAEDLRAYLKASGVTPGAASLRMLMDDSERFEQETRAKVADAAVSTARGFARRGEFAKALAELSRATTYVPKHPEAERLFASITSRRRWMKVGAVAAGILAVGAVSVKVLPWLSDRLARTEGVVAEAEGPAAVTTTRGAPPAPPVVEPAKPDPPPPVAESPRPPAPTAAKASVTRKKAGRTKAAVPAPAAVAAEPTPAAPEPPPPTPEPTPAAPAPPPAPRKIMVHMYAAHLFCSPSLDNEAPGMAPRYATLEGKHKIWCTMPGGEKVPVATLDLVERDPGVPVRVQIKRGPSDKPAIDWSQTTKPRHPDPDPSGKPAGSGSVPR